MKTLTKIAMLTFCFASSGYAAMRTFTIINNTGEDLIIEEAVYCTVGTGVNAPTPVPGFEVYTIDKSPPGSQEVVSFPYVVTGNDYPTCELGYKHGVSILMA